jgi:hypothetical protein
MVAVYELDDAGLISAWREYLDMENLEQKLGGEPAPDPTSEPDEETIGRFVTDQYRLWSEGEVDEMLALFRRIAPNGYTVKYVGQPAQPGEVAMAEMIEAYPTRSGLIFSNSSLMAMRQRLLWRTVSSRAA